MFLFICFLCTIDFAVAQDLWINEIFPNPLGEDNNREFVEIYSTEFVNLSSFIIGDNASNDTLVALQYFDGNYSLIVEEGFNYSDINASIYSVGATIGNNLGNSGDGVFFHDTNGTLLDFVFYETLQEGYSYEKNESGWFRSTIENGTPGKENSIASVIENITTLFVEQDAANITGSNVSEMPLLNILTLTALFPQEIYTTQTITTGFRIENKGKEKITAQLVYTVSFNDSTIINETTTFENVNQYRTKDTVAVTLQEAGNYTLCGTVTSNTTEEDFSDNTACASFTVIDPTLLSCDKNIVLEVDKIMYQNNEQISFLPMITGAYADLPFVFSYWIEEFSGKIVKQPRNSSITTTKQWTPSIHESYAIHEIHATLLETTCLDTNMENNHAMVYVIVENQLYEEDSLSTNQAKQNTEEKNTKEEQLQKREEKNSEEEYSLITFPRKAYVNETIKSFILLHNIDTQEHRYKISSKIYRGPKTYVGANFENRQTIILQEGEKEQITLKNSLMNISPGTYKIKIQIQKDDYKTLKEFRDELAVLEAILYDKNVSVFFGDNQTVENKTRENKPDKKTSPQFIVPENSTISSENGTYLGGEILAQNVFYENPFSAIKQFFPYLFGIFVLLLGITLFFYKA